MMHDNSFYLVYDGDGYKIVGHSGRAQFVIAGPCSTIDEAMRQAFASRNYQPVAIKLESC